MAIWQDSRLGTRVPPAARPYCQVRGIHFCDIPLTPQGSLRMLQMGKRSFTPENQPLLTPAHLRCWARGDPRAHTAYRHFLEDWGKTGSGPAPFRESGAGLLVGSVLVIGLLRRNSHTTQFTRLKYITQGLGCSSVCNQWFWCSHRLCDCHCNQFNLMHIYFLVLGVKPSTSCMLGTEFIPLVPKLFDLLKKKHLKRGLLFFL